MTQCTAFLGIFATFHSQLLHPSYYLPTREGAYSLSDEFGYDFFNLFSSPPPTLSSRFFAMEDCNMLAADCVVISCCCQCLILQITIFILFKLPYKLIKKTRDFTIKKLQQRKQKGRKGIVVETRREVLVLNPCEDDLVSVIGESMRSIEAAGLSCRCCMEEVDKVLQELSKKGEFGFGSFWRRDEFGSSSSSPKYSPKDVQFDSSFVRYHFIEMVGSVSNGSQIS